MDLLTPPHLEDLLKHSHSTVPSPLRWEGPKTPPHLSAPNWEAIADDLQCSGYFIPLVKASPNYSQATCDLGIAKVKAV